jgi:hypothetical protein
MVARQGKVLQGARPLAATALGLSFTMITGATMAKTFHLSILGEDGARYSGACTIMAGSGDESIELEGVVPLKREFDGDGLICRFRAEGQVVVEIAHNGSRSRSATTGGTIRVSAR